MREPYGRSNPHADALRTLTLASTKRMATISGQATEYNNVVVVDPSGAGDYTTLTSALAGITDASATNRYGVVMMPGIYTDKDIGLVDGVDIMALVPGTVLFQPTSSPSIAIFNRTDALTAGIQINGIQFELDLYAYNRCCVALSYAGAMNATFRNCRFVVPSGGSDGNYGVYLTLATSGAIVLDDCVIEQNPTSVTSPALYCYVNGATVIVSHCRMTVNGTATSSRVISVRGSGLSIYLSELSGGEYAIAVPSSTATIALALTRMTANLGTDVTNTIEIPHNATNIAKPTTSHTGATTVYNSGQAVNISTTFDGYTLAQVVRALRDLGFLT